MPIVAQTCAVLNVTNMDISQWTVLIEYHCQVHLPATRDRAPTQDAAPDLHLGTITKTDIRIAGQGHSPILTDITVIVELTHTGVAQGHITDTTTEALHDVSTPALITTTMTHHTGDHPHIEVP